MDTERPDVSDPASISLLAMAGGSEDGASPPPDAPTVAASSAVVRRPGEIAVSGIAVAVNSCPVCKGDEVCRNCNGTKKVPDYSNYGLDKTCPKCRGSARCQRCVGHVRVLSSFAKELEDGSPGSAEACLQRALMGNVQEEQKSRSMFSIGAAGVGAFLGTVVAPGLGTVVGLSFGKMFGDATESSENWRQADLLYSLGILYASQDRKAEASQAWIRALTLHESHERTRTALKEAM